MSISSLSADVSPGLSLAADKNRTGDSASNESNAPAKRRAEPYRALLSKEERAAHESFVESLGEDAVWRRYRP